jgi:lysyl-tRNA synthetase class 2
LNRGNAERLTYAEAFSRYVGVDPHRATIEELASIAETKAPQGAAAFQQSKTPTDRDAWLDLLLTECVEPHLGRKSPTILCDYPATQAALAQLRGDPPVAERFELYVDGIELANGYHELLDAETLLKRNLESNRLREADGKPPLPVESRLLDAMRSGLPPCTGCALGFDRIVMLACGKHDIAKVLPFPFERA